MSVWGKVIGGAAGFALGGPLGAMMGVMAGNIYDKKRKISASQQGIPNQQKQYQGISNQEKQHIFALSVITLTAKLAKADGVVTQDEIEVFLKSDETWHRPTQEFGSADNFFNILWSNALSDKFNFFENEKIIVIKNTTNKIYKIIEELIEKNYNEIIILDLSLIHI